jgi:hypothetical protein
MWFLLSGLYKAVSGSTVHTIKICRKTNGIRRCFTEVAVLNVMGEEIGNLRPQYELNTLLVIREYGWKLL